MATQENVPISLQEYKRDDDADKQNIGSDSEEVRSNPELEEQHSNSKLKEQLIADDKSESRRKKRIFLAIKVVFGVFFFVLVLTCTIFSKLTLVSLTDKLRRVTHYNGSQLSSDKEDIAISIYWQLLLVMTIPTFITLLRSFFLGVLGKSTENYPWPKFKSIIAGIIASLFEVGAISVFVFVVMAELPPVVSLLLLGGVFFYQIAVDIWYVNTCSCTCRKPECVERQCRRGYNNLSNEEHGGVDDGPVKAAVKTPTVRIPTVIYYCFEMLLENRIVKTTALLIQVASMAVFIGFWCYTFDGYPNVGGSLYKLKTIVAIPICLLVLSFIWTNTFQDWIALIYNNKEGVKTARYKSSFINSLVRLLLYPFVTYAVFRLTHQIDPLCLNSSCVSGVHFSGQTLSVFIAQICTTLFAYIFAWVACTMTLGPYSVALPLLISTPLSVTAYYIILYSPIPLFPYFGAETAVLGRVYPWGPAALLFLWVGQVLGIAFYVCTKRNVILSLDSDMFLIPYYDGIFLEQQMILNRQTKKHAQRQNTRGENEAPTRKPRAIFICTTMYREDCNEMKQILTSINGVAKHYEREKKMDLPNCDSYESHIFFDGALNGTQLLEFGLQLLALLEEIFGKKPDEGIKKKTPYGMCLRYQLNHVHHMPFHIHFKDKNLVKPKKRWSQVMYINYIINHRIGKHNPPNAGQKMTLENTFILTTDADVDFTPKSAVVLLDMLESNPRVGAVCARTHPKGSGPLYWYQIFDYAIGHWFQKPAEHLLGCVLCSPGCFSVFRCSALQQVLETYSTLATNGMEFLMKDMGEDRWLSTLLIKKGWRLEYCATSESKTYCPQTFEQFYAQRRRWIPSTLANLSLLFTNLYTIIRSNDTMSFLFILFQGIMVFSTSISPATVILVIASGLQSAFSISDFVVSLVIFLLVIVSILYGVVCLYSSPKTQIEVAKILTFLFTITMVIVISGIFSHVVNAIFHHPYLTDLNAPNCSQYVDLKANTKCNEAVNFLDTTSFGHHRFILPVSINIIYFGLFAFTFLTAALLHPTEFACLFHCIWYLLALPSGYLLLLIYSAANLDSQSWGTREGSSGIDKGLLGWGKYFKRAWLWCCRCCRPYAPAQVPQEEIDPLCSIDSEDDPMLMACAMEESAKQWLRREECENYIKKFEEHGYTTLHYIAMMTLADFEAIGIDKRGYRLRILKAAAKLPSFSIHVDVPRDVASWLTNLNMEDYIDLFKREGYSKNADVENLKGLTEIDLITMGIAKKAHLQRLVKALHFLVYPNKIEQKMAKTKADIEMKPTSELNVEEYKFWEKLVAGELKPTLEQLTSVIDLKKSLRNLRNATLIGLFLINMTWILVLYIIRFPILADYGLEVQAFQLLFLAVYGFIIAVQFAAMIFHRGITLVHKFGRITPKELSGLTPDDFTTVEHETQIN